MGRFGQYLAILTHDHGLSMEQPPPNGPYCRVRDAFAPAVPPEPSANPLPVNAKAQKNSKYSRISQSLTSEASEASEAPEAEEEASASSYLRISARFIITR